MSANSASAQKTASGVDKIVSLGKMLAGRIALHAGRHLSQENVGQVAHLIREIQETPGYFGSFNDGLLEPRTPDYVDAILQCVTTHPTQLGGRTYAGVQKAHLHVRRGRFTEGELMGGETSFASVKWSGYPVLIHEGHVAKRMRLRGHRDEAMPLDSTDLEYLGLMSLLNSFIAEKDKSFNDGRPKPIAIPYGESIDDLRAGLLLGHIEETDSHFFTDVKHSFDETGAVLATKGKPASSSRIIAKRFNYQNDQATAWRPKFVTVVNTFVSAHDLTDNNRRIFGSLFGAIENFSELFVAILLKFEQQAAAQPINAGMFKPHLAKMSEYAGQEITLERLAELNERLRNIGADDAVVNYLHRSHEAMSVLRSDDRQHGIPEDAKLRGEYRVKQAEIARKMKILENAGVCGPRRDDKPNAPSGFVASRPSAG
jgi:hypothetical protein